MKIATTILFTLLCPLMTFVLLGLKGFPSFAKPHPLSILLWVYSVTWIPAFLSGIFLSMIISYILKHTQFFHRPYDFGRSFSAGALAGALLEALFTGLYRALSDRPFSDFWIAGAMIAGCLTGAAVTTWAFWRASLSRQPPLK